jgi:cell wall-associated NlpC family hydrolase
MLACGTAAAKQSAVKIFGLLSLALAGLGALQSARADAFPLTGPTVPGTRAVLRGNIAAAPAAAPLEVKRAIWAANQLRSKRYRYGGGHRSFVDSGYDCSGTVSYALGAAGLVKSPMPSSGFKKFGQSGTGKWITVYARNGHTFAVIAGLRLDTTAWNTLRRETGEAPRWRATPREPRGFVARHPAGL